MNAKLICIVLLVMFAEPSFADAGCSPKTAAFVEQKAARIESWEEFATFYLRHAACDRSALRTAFTGAVVNLASKDEGMTGLSAMLKIRPKLRSTVFHHLQSEAISTDEQEKILKSTSSCATPQKALCKAVIATVK